MQGDDTAAVSEILAAAGIAAVIVTFDDSGDASQMEDSYAHDATGAETALPVARVKLANMEFDALAAVTEACNPREVIDSMTDGPFERVHNR